MLSGLLAVEAVAAESASRSTARIASSARTSASVTGDASALVVTCEIALIQRADDLARRRGRIECGLSSADAMLESDFAVHAARGLTMRRSWQ